MTSRERFEPGLFEARAEPQKCLGCGTCRAKLKDGWLCPDCKEEYSRDEWGIA